MSLWQAPFLVLGDTLRVATVDSLVLGKPADSPYRRLSLIAITEIDGFKIVGYRQKKAGHVMTCFVIII